MLINGTYKYKTVYRYVTAKPLNINTKNYELSRKNLWNKYYIPLIVAIKSITGQKDTYGIESFLRIIEEKILRFQTEAFITIYNDIWENLSEKGVRFTITLHDDEHKFYQHLLTKYTIHSLITLYKVYERSLVDIQEKIVSKNLDEIMEKISTSNYELSITGTETKIAETLNNDYTFSITQFKTKAFSELKFEINSIPTKIKTSVYITNHKTARIYLRISEKVLIEHNKGYGVWFNIEADMSVYYKIEKNEVQITPDLRYNIFLKGSPLSKNEIEKLKNISYRKELFTPIIEEFTPDKSRPDLFIYQWAEYLNKRRLIGKTSTLLDKPMGLLYNKPQKNVPRT